MPFRKTHTKSCPSTFPTQTLPLSLPLFLPNAAAAATLAACDCGTTASDMELHGGCPGGKKSKEKFRRKATLRRNATS